MGRPGLHPRRSMQHERPFEFLFPRVELAQLSLKESQVEAQPGLRPFIPESESRHQRVRRHVTRLLEQTKLVTEQGTHRMVHPHLEAAVAELAPDGGCFSRALDRRGRIPSGQVQGVDPGIYGFDAQSVEGGGLAHGLDADLVPASRQHVEHVQAQP